VLQAQAVTHQAIVIIGKSQYRDRIPSSVTTIADKPFVYVGCGSNREEILSKAIKSLSGRMFSTPHLDQLRIVGGCKGIGKTQILHAIAFAATMLDFCYKEDVIVVPVYVEDPIKNGFPWRPLAFAAAALHKRGLLLDEHGMPPKWTKDY